MEDKVTIDKQTLKALVVESRLDILKLLIQKKYTLSDIAELLNLKKSTVSEHMKILEESGLVKKEDTKRKWKYYSLTFKGRKLVQPKEVAVLFAFAINILALVGAFGMLFRNSVGQFSDVSMEVASRSVAAPEAAVMMADAAPVATSSGPSVTILVLVFVLTLSAGILLGYLFRQSVVVVGGKK